MKITKSMFSVVAVGLICATTLASLASAATESFGPVSVGPNPTGSGGSFALSQFDPSLGSLTQVDLFITGNSDGGSNGLQNLSGFPGTASVAIGSDITVSGPASLTVLTFPNNSNSGTVAPYTGAVDFTFSGPDSILVNGVPSVDSNSNSILVGLAPYIGLSNVNFNFSSSANTSNSASVSPTFSSTTAPTFGFSATVTYHYNPVPEPSTIALFGLGIVGLVGYGIRRRGR